MSTTAKMIEKVKPMNTIQAVNMALDEAMGLDANVILLGEDIADGQEGGIVGVTKGLSTKYGNARVRSTPIAEQAIVGAAIGAAIVGLRPVAEIMLMNFTTVAMDMIVNHAAKLRYMSGGQTHVPLTIRTMTGAGFGTGGTLKGVARVLAKERPETKIVVCEPEDAPMLSSGVEQERNPDGSAKSGHPSWKPHPMQGWSPDFIAKLTGDAVASKAVSQVLTIQNADALRCSKELAKKEGIFVGISSGATFAGALRVAAEAPKGSTILCMLPDTGERYLSTPLFADVSVDMTEEEWEIARSTPGCLLQPPQ